MFKPFTPSKYSTVIFSLGLFVFIIFWQFSEGSVIPHPLGIVGEMKDLLLNENEFYIELMRSVLLSIEAMAFSMLVSLVLVYLSTIEVFKGLAVFVSKCRYLTVTGLTYIFTVLTSSTHDMKMLVLP